MIVEKMRRTIFILLVLVILLPAAFLLLTRYRFVVKEGYPTWEAVWNYLIHEGEIVIQLPEGVEVISARCDDRTGDVRIDGRKVTTKIGYTWCRISIQTKSNKGYQTIYFNSQKLNNWNRILYVPVDPTDPNSDFSKFENGVHESHDDVTRESTANKTSLLNRIIPLRLT